MSKIMMFYDYVWQCKNKHKFPLSRYESFSSYVMLPKTIWRSLRLSRRRVFWSSAAHPKFWSQTQIRQTRHTWNASAPAYSVYALCPVWLEDFSQSSSTDGLTVPKVYFDFWNAVFWHVRNQDWNFGVLFAQWLTAGSFILCAGIFFVPFFYSGIFSHPV